MPKVNIDDMVRDLFEPIIFTLDGKEYTIEVIPSEALDKLDPNSTDINAVRKVLAEILGVKEETFKKVDYRKLIAATGYIMSIARKQVEAYQSKNEQRGNVAQKQ